MTSFDPGITQCINTYNPKKNIPNYNDNCDFYPDYAPHYHYFSSETFPETLSELSEILSVRILILTLFPTTRLSVKLTHLPSRKNYSLTLMRSLSQHSPE